MFPDEGPGRQPWLHDLVITLKAPTVVLCENSGQIRPGGPAGNAQGMLHSDVRVLSEAVVTVGGEEPSPIGHSLLAAGATRFSAIARNLGDPTPDPTVRLDRTRRVSDGSVHEQIEVSSTASAVVSSWVEVRLACDLAKVEQIKSALAGPAATFTVLRVGEAILAHWSGTELDVDLSAPDAVLGGSDVTELILRWPLELQPRGRRTIEWTLTASSSGAPVIGFAGTDESATVTADDHRISALARQSRTDLAALRMAPAGEPSQAFYAAGAPWFFTLFGRDSLWAARLMLPLDRSMALGTLQALAARQGTTFDPVSAQAPGKIPHELRGAETVHEGGHGGARMRLPALYYGTIDATPLWICLLHDAWLWGLPDDDVKRLLPQLKAALGWLRDYADPDEDGFLEYLDLSGHGLANQGWKDSGDSIRFSDGRIAEGPVALCEVQGYAYEAATGAAALLDHFGEDGAGHWRDWAAGLAGRFRQEFWVDDGRRRFPALALDGSKRRVDSLTSNIGHLLGTGILDDDESALVAELLTSPGLSSGFGLRTMSSDESGYSALSYHCGSVWAHDTAIAIHGLVRSGRTPASYGLIEGLLTAAAAFDYRLPELYSGDSPTSAGAGARPMPYPAACRPQAWAAAAIGPILQALAGLLPEGSQPPGDSPFGAVRLLEEVR